MSEIKFKLAAGTNVGLIRQNNEDNFVVCSDLSTSNWLIPQAGDYADLGKLGFLLVVADGMGGANAGEVASAIAVETIQDHFAPEQLEEVISNDKTVQEFMKEVVKSADLNILHHSQEDSSTQGMGTTIVMAWILNVQELVDKGELDPELMHDHPLSNVITRCLGDVDKRANPETRIYQLNNGDIIMLCSDGLCGLCHDQEILDTMIEHVNDPIACKNELISAALSAGGYDNVTVALARIQTDEAEIEEEPNEEEKKKDDSADEDKEEELTTTIRSEVIGHKTHKLRNFMLFLLLLIIAGGAYIWFSPDCITLKNHIITTVINFVTYLQQKN